MEWTDTAFICMCIAYICLAVSSQLNRRTVKELREELEALKHEGDERDDHAECIDHES